MEFRGASVLGLGLAVVLSTSAAAALPRLHVVKKVVLGGDGGWDYLLADATSRRLYVTRGDRVVVLDADALKPVGEIAGTAGVHGVALAPELGLGYASAGKAGQVVVFDLKTLKQTAAIEAGKNPDAILYDAATKRVFAFNGKSHDATVIDAASGKAVATIPLGGKPEFSAADGAGNVYVNIEDKGELVRLDAAAAKETARWKLDGCDEPSGLTIDAGSMTLFAVCGNKKMAIVDAATGKVVATPEIGEHPDAAGFDPGTGWAYSSNGDGTLTVVGKGADGKYAVVETVKTEKGARTMALDSKTHRVFLATADFGPAPAATADHPHQRPAMKPGTFRLLVVGK